MPDKTKVGIIGVGHMGQYHVNVARGIADFEVVGLYDRDPMRRAEIGGRFGVEQYDDMNQLIDKCDAVVIAVPTVHHYAVAKLAMQKGKHVLVEKPLTETVAQAEELVAMAAENDLVLQVGHVERFNGAVLELGKVVDQPALIESRRLAPFNPRIGDVGVVLDLMIHDLDIVLNLVHEDVIAVHGTGRKVFSNHEDVAVAEVQFQSGCVASLIASRATQNKVRTLTITQEKAYIMLDFTTQDIDIHRRATSAYLMTREELKYKQESFVEKIFVHKDNPLRQEHLHFLGTIRGEHPPIVPGANDVRTLAIAHRILESIHADRQTISAAPNLD